jgi:hypothetical protein
MSFEYAHGKPPNIKGYSILQIPTSSFESTGEKTTSVLLIQSSPPAAVEGMPCMT